ncbi:MAG: DUF1971 domain-containing protein [Pseudolabrys sp.]|nr:DUF1971 domain-containing protein [Pseudolabrys sp.]
MVKTTDAGQLPVGLAAYKRTPVFDQDGLPAALQENHRTKAGVWGLIHVLEGRLAYTTFEPPTERILAPDSPGVVQPGQLHKVQPVGAVRFFVEFYRAALDEA